MTHETPATIDQWQRETFPNATASGVYDKLIDELYELGCSMADGESDDVLAAEAADVAIVAIQYIQKLGLDPQAVIDAKMAKNRSREWNIRADGTGQHVDENG